MPLTDAQCRNAKCLPDKKRTLPQPYHPLPFYLPRLGYIEYTSADGKFTNTDVMPLGLAQQDTRL